MKILKLITLASLAIINSGIYTSAQTKVTAAQADYLKLPRSDENEKKKATIAEILKEDVEVEDIKNNQTGDAADIQVLDDRIEFRIRNKNKVLYYYEFSDQVISPEQPKIKYFLRVADFKFISRSLAVRHTNGVATLSSCLTSFQFQLKKEQYDYELTLFEPAAEKYRALSVKPAVSEEQRKFIVQANLLTGQKDYENAINIYRKAVELDQTSYPSAYSNMALLSAQVNDYNLAIYNMKKYLLLVPDAADARGAQDKIYEWELLMNKQI